MGLWAEGIRREAKVGDKPILESTRDLGTLSMLKKRSRWKRWVLDTRSNIQ